MVSEFSPSRRSEKKEKGQAVVCCQGSPYLHHSDEQCILLAKCQYARGLNVQNTAQYRRCCAKKWPGDFGEGGESGLATVVKEVSGQCLNSDEEAAARAAWWARYIEQ